MSVAIDLTSERYGRLVVLKFAGKRRRKRFWSCRCECGQRIDVRSDQLTRGIARSCGCLQRETAREMRLRAVSKETIKLRKVRADRAAKGLPSNLGVRDLTGRRFGQLTVLKFLRIQNQQSLWRCQCSCSKKTTVTASRLGYGWTKSCGCGQLANLDRRTHEQSNPRTSEYLAWNSMKTRCLNPKNKRWEDYGGRGITICKRWLNSFENFFADMGPKPSARHSLDRINPNGNYTPRNCRWATHEQQNSNRR